MKNFYLILLFIIVTLNNYGQTDVSGNITVNTQWNLSGSPYNLVGNVNIASEKILTIEPGVIINGNNYSINIYGILNAIGDSAQIGLFLIIPI